MTLRVIFLGTPEFAIPSLKALLADPEIEVLGVMTQPDRPSGRGQKLTPPPIKVLALENGLEVVQPSRPRKEPEMIEWLRTRQPDYLVTAAFGQILPQEVLDIPKYGVVNVHASLLPKYRGANPVQWSIINGDPVTGVTTMLTELDVDTGAMLQKAETEIRPDDTAVTVLERLSQLGAEILPQSLHQFASGQLQATAQNHDEATHARKLEKEDAQIDWTQSAQQLHNKIRGQQPWPGTVTQFGDQPIKLAQSRTPKGWDQAGQYLKSDPPGTILATIKEGIVVQTGNGPLLIEKLQPPGKPVMLARDWANGALQNITTPRFDAFTKVAP